MLDLPDFLDIAYEGDPVKPQMMNQRAAPSDFLSDLVCFCSVLCAEDCVCLYSEQLCTVACSCKD